MAARYSSFIVIAGSGARSVLFVCEEKYGKRGGAGLEHRESGQGNGGARGEGGPGDRGMEARVALGQGGRSATSIQRDSRGNQSRQI